MSPTSEEMIQTALKVVRQAQDELVPSNERLDAAVANSVRAGLPHIAIGPAQGQYLSILCQLIGARSILEIGTLGGYSTIWFATSHPDVRVMRIEFNPKHRDIALENLRGLDNADVILGAALEVLPQLAEAGRQFDLVFIDADWGEQWPYFDWAVKMVRPGGCIIVDNAVRMLTESDPDDASARLLIDRVKADTRVQATLIPAMNTEKEIVSEIIDGFLMAIKK